MNDEIYKGVPIRWINTPLSYAQLTTQYNLFQQAVLLKVSEYIQDQIRAYFGSDLQDCTDVPRPLFTEEQKRMGIGRIEISYAELGVSLNNFAKVKQEAYDCLSKMVVGGPIIMKNGQPTQSLYPVFKEVNIDHSSSTCTFVLNTDIIPETNSEHVIDYTFDMSKRYVKHPDNIAILGKIEKMPGLYFLLRDSMQSWRFKRAKLTVTQIREFLNMYKNKDGERVPMYPKFSKFKKHVLEPALADISRLKSIGQIDHSFSMECIYKTKRQAGDPAFIVFTINDEKRKPAEQNFFTEAQTVETQKQTPLQAEEGRALWSKCLASVDDGGRLAQWCEKHVVCHGLRDGRMEIGCSDFDALKSHESFAMLDSSLRSALGKGKFAPVFLVV